MVEWSIPAKEDLKQVHDYISKDSRFYARKVTEQIIDKSETLNNFRNNSRHQSAADKVPPEKWEVRK